MKVLKILLVGVALGVDAFSVATALGTRGFKTLQILKISLVVGFFHVLMSLIGLNLGYLVGHVFANQINLDQLVLDSLTTLLGSSLLIILGLLMIYHSLTENETEAIDLKVLELKGWGLVFLALSVSIDALSVGFSLAMFNISFLLTCLLFGITSTIMVAIGLLLGNQISNLIGIYSEIIGGGVLISIGLYFLLTI